MGQQQLLLIILGVIIVGIAVAVGINMFTASASAANRDAVASDLTNLAAMAQQHYRRPAAMGGGANSFDGTGPDRTANTPDDGTVWLLPSALDTTANGTYTTTVPNADSVVIIGTGTETGNVPEYTGTTPAGLVQMRTVVTSTQIRSTVIN